MRRFQNISALSVPLPDSTLEPAGIAEFERVPHEVTLLAASGVLQELVDEQPTDSVSSAGETKGKNK